MAEEYSEKPDERKEIKRAIILYVDEVLKEPPPDLVDSFTQPRRNVRLEMSLYQAKQLRDQLDALIEKNNRFPGSIGVQLKGHLTI